MSYLDTIAPPSVLKQLQNDFSHVNEDHFKPICSRIVDSFLSQNKYYRMDMENINIITSSDEKVTYQIKIILYAEKCIPQLRDIEVTIDDWEFQILNYEVKFQN